MMISGVRHEYMEARLSERDFKRLGALIQTRTGIKMPPHKIAMLESRLRKRLRRLKIPSYNDYCKYLFSPEGMKDELVHMIDEVTTNKTDFFREPDHFDFLRETVLPEMLNGRYRRISIWSAACSTGEEPYSLAMALEIYLESHPEVSFDYSILGTDISEEVLEKAATAIYDEQLVDSMPLELKKRYLLRSKDNAKRLVRVTPELRNKVIFRKLNLMDKYYGLDKYMDIIFCRNVIIYFERETQKELLNKICGSLNQGGYLFMGHAEVLAGFELPVESIAPTVYKKTV